MSDTEKHAQLTQAAAACFARYGYKKTTVDEIVAAAGVSKGLFYHYFTDKKDVYLRLYDLYAAALRDSVNRELDTAERDFFERLKQIAHRRIDFIRRYPALWGFLYSAYYEDHPDVAAAIRAKNEALVRESGSGSAANIDWSKLRPDVTPAEAITVVTWLAEGFVRQINAGELSLERADYLEFDRYIELLKSGLYAASDGGE